MVTQTIKITAETKLSKQGLDSLAAWVLESFVAAHKMLVLNADQVVTLKHLGRYGVVWKIVSQMSPADKKLIAVKMAASVHSFADAQELLNKLDEPFDENDEPGFVKKVLLPAVSDQWWLIDHVIMPLGHPIYKEDWQAQQEDERRARQKDNADLEEAIRLCTRMGYQVIPQEDA